MKFPIRCFMFCLKRYFLSHKFLLVLTCALSFVIIVQLINFGNRIARIDSVLNGTKPKTTTPRPPAYLNPERLKQIMTNKRNNNLMAKKNKANLKAKMWKEKIDRLDNLRPKPEIRHVEVNKTIGPNYKVHVFYYAWYENEMIDGAWQHWNHEYLKNWMKNDKKLYPTGRHIPPDDIGSNFYPELGCYSSRDPDVVDVHLKQIRDAGIGVLVVSWYPPNMSDGPSRTSPDTIFLQLLDAAQKYHLKVAAHIEPYRGRHPENLLQHLKYFTNSYSNHPALYKIKKGDKDLIVYYIYDSYRTPAYAWRELLDPNGNITVRKTSEDGIFLGLLVDFQHKHEIRRARFDGFYTYFASNGFSYGSSWKNWKNLAVFARLQNLIFIPSIGPGYIDTRIRPWNSANTRHRRNGNYYEVGWRAAINAGAHRVSITSFNEWHEGTQIEPAIPKATKDFVYLNYEPEGPDFYMNLTKFWINEFSKKSNQNVPIL